MKEDKSKKKAFKFIDLFAGIGGFHTAMHENGGECVFASEIDKFARQTYEHNFESISPELFKNNNFNQDITDKSLAYNDIPDFDVLCAGFPCQAFSIAGYRQGFSDEKGRGNLFFNILEILRIKMPQLFLLENVKNLKTHDEGKTFQRICHELTKLGYGINSKILNGSDFGLPQNRERIFIVGIKDGWTTDPIPAPTEDYVLKEKELEELISKNPSNAMSKFEFPIGDQKLRLNQFSSNPHKIKTEFNNNLVEYFDPPKELEEFFESYADRSDWSKFIYNFKDGHFQKVTNYIDSKLLSNQNIYEFEDWSNDDWEDSGYDYIYQWRRKYVRRNSSSVCPTLTANMGTGGHNVPLVICGRTTNGYLIRKLTPVECFAFQGFDKENFIELEKKMSAGHLYKQAGNSIPVNVVKAVIENLIQLL